MKIDINLRADAIVVRYAMPHPQTGIPPTDEMIVNYYRQAKEVSPVVLAMMLENLLVETWGAEHKEGYLQGRVKSFSEQAMAACVIEKYPREDLFLGAVHHQRTLMAKKAKRPTIGGGILDRFTPNHNGNP